MATADIIDALRDELQRVRIERAGLLSDIEQLKAELARLRTENEKLRAELAAMPKKKRGAKKRQTEAVAPAATEIAAPSAAEAEAALEDLTKGTKPAAPTDR
jgi:regulator of replication initiation timing